MRTVCLPLLCLMTGILSVLLTISQAQPTVVYEPLITSGLSTPMEVKSAPGDATGRLFIVERGGNVKIWDGTTILATPFINISSLIIAGGERGLLSMAFHPDYATNGFFFLYYNDPLGNITVSRFKVSAGDPNVADPAPNPSAPLISVAKPFTNHNGGHLQFKSEGTRHYLYFGTGDGGDANDPFENAQNPATFLGKMIRVNVDSTPITPRVWDLGLRNPFRWSFDKVTGDMWIGDVGQDAIEEIDFLEGGIEGANFGWRCFEGTMPNGAIDPCDPPGKIPPLYEYDNPVEGRSVVGGYVYRGTEYPDLTGLYLATDFYTGTLWLIQKTGATFDIQSQPGMRTGVTSISETEDSTLYAVVAGSLLNGARADTVFKITTLTVAPLTLTQFTGAQMNGYNELKWKTAEEQDIQKFVVEFSIDGTSYTPAGEVKASNNPTGASYSFQHTIAGNEKIFYRLRIDELDGSKQYSAVINLGKNIGSEIKIYPTLVNNGMIQVNSGQRIQKVDIFSSDGRNVFSQSINDMTGYFTIPLPALQKGLYIIRLTGDKSRKNERIIIQ